jgi:deoxyribose-phosphate aldolase
VPIPSRIVPRRSTETGIECYRRRASVELSGRHYAKRFDTSPIKPDASEKKVVGFIERCRKYSAYLAAVAFNPHHIPLTAKHLANSH